MKFPHTAGEFAVPPVSAKHNNAKNSLPGNRLSFVLNNFVPVLRLHEHASIFILSPYLVRIHLAS